MNAAHAAWVAANLADAQRTPVTRADLDILGRHLIATIIERGEVLFDRGGVPRGVWILRSGAVELISGSGRDKAVVRILGPGEAVGDVQLIRGVPSMFKARAADHCESLFIPGAEFLELLASSATIARRWTSKLAVQVSRNHERITELLTSSLRARVVRFLLTESVDDAFSHSQSTIASMLGVHRSSVNEVLRELEASGAVEVGYRYISIMDREKLDQLASKPHS